VYAGAFDSLTSLTEFDMSGAQLMQGCFYGCTKLAQINFNYSDVKRFVDLFGTDTYDVIPSGSGNFKYIDSEDFFEGVKGL
ncbi:MAG: hypothetical protein K2M95_06875, partial [Clostridiales bacterium]|nr:hypothetical protein [Clostridiales bacterium]